MNNNIQMPLEFESNDSLAGFRLARVEVLNWGTFNEKVWTLSLDGRNVLLTGDIGSGKSTIVDAITTLLIPAHRISYNKAAGAEIRERSLKSYVQGYYKSEKTESGHGSKPVALRDQNSYSVILGVFTNKGFDQVVTLAQVFWQKELQGQPNRFFVIADGELSIREHFSNFGSDIKNLKKQLKAIPFLDDCYENFPQYAASYRRRFGIEDEQAMELFHQTVSMKSVGNLTEFVRSHMLESFDIEPRIGALITHFDDLSRAHNAVLKAKEQVERLKPLVSDIDRHNEFTIKRNELRSHRESLKYYFACLKSELLDKRLKNLDDEQRKVAARITKLQEKYSRQQGERDNIKQAIAENGGDRLERLASDINAAVEKKNDRLQKSEEYISLAKQISVPQPDSSESFINNRTRIRESLATFDGEEQDIQNKRTDAEVERKSVRDEHNTILVELESLKKRRSNIDSRQIKIRSDLCESLGIKEDDLPFIGELLQIRPEESKWEGVIERLLRNFALSLLVPDRLYADVSSWVEKTNLKGRVVYYKVGAKPSQEITDLNADSLVHKLSVKSDNEFSSWIEHELGRRFDYSCCTDLAQFRREKQAVTVSGQIKGSGNRHEKDDRHDIHDRSRYVLGWNNDAKISALDAKRLHIEKTIQKISRAITDLQGTQKSLGKRKELFVRIDGFSKYDDIDWKSVALQIDELEREKKKLESTSDILKTLNTQLAELESSIKDTSLILDKEKDERSKHSEKQDQTKILIEQCREIIGQNKNDESPAWFEKMDSIRNESLGEHQLTVESAEHRQQEVREWLQRKIDNEDKRLKTFEEKIIRSMQDYRRDYVSETRDVDARLESGPEFREMLVKLEADDLPQFEARFKALLNENTIREIANFQSQLNRERQTITEKIARINQSLSGIEYNKGRYIVLEAQPNADNEIREFQQSLRICTEGSLTGSGEEQYAETKFIQVKTIIDRFRGREGTSDLDKRWTQKTTDVRNWFVFAASERWIEDHSEHERYTDSGGKSGGQKEKLAYTVLAASLAYQFGLEWGEVRSRSFRFVLIDEAFGRGSDESARFGLELFKRLNLQILIVTPLQKIHIIEPYVSNVGFVHTLDGRESQIRNLTIEEYRSGVEAKAGETHHA